VTLGALLAGSVTALTAAPASAAETLLSQGRPATASSSEGAAFTAPAAVDGNLTGTRWASQWSDNQWHQVDLGQSAAVSRVVLTWEAAYGKAYDIQLSDNGSDWRTVKSVTGGDGGTDDIASPERAATSVSRASPAPPATATPCGSSRSTATTPPSRRPGEPSGSPAARATGN